MAEWSFDQPVYNLGREPFLIHQSTLEQFHLIPWSPKTVDQLLCESVVLIVGSPPRPLQLTTHDIVELQLKDFVFFNMKMTHQSTVAAAALCVVVIVMCSSGASARVLREGDIFERILGGVTVKPNGNGILHNIPGDAAQGTGTAAGHLTVLGSPGPSTTVSLPPISIDIIPPTPSALPPCVAVPPMVSGALPPSVKGALPPIPACIGAPPLPNTSVPPTP